MRRTIDAQLAAAQLLIDNSLRDADIRAALAEFGYDETRLRRGEELYQSALALHQQQQTAYSLQFAATDLYHRRLRNAKATYRRHLKLARALFDGDRVAAKQLGLRGPRKASFAGWYDQAAQFYENALGDPAIVEALTKIGLDEEVLRTTQDLIVRTAIAKESRERARGDARATTQARRAAMQLLHRWCAQLTQIARIALVDSATALVKLGIVHPI